ncbi:hypothetical protein [Paenibacillus glycanilyticus]|uniref:Phosphodiester glycosidase domain-containing protein n=1 Tax=Paenibacillus glycanilyticus TaxID=126569 RepID=A0ABQ6GL18_9BACL|nr:hypothetical protein [Paenibacillus glycanilyticus]GLX70765.1 hypothetical protein MU1_51110 [Paenibacillus glycanilyticus]
MNGRTRKLSIAGVMAVILVLLGLMFAGMIYLLFIKSDGLSRNEHYPTGYVYIELEASNGMKLHVLETNPSNVTLASIQNNVALSSYYGVNGGFFYQEALLSMAVVDGMPVNGPLGQYGSGEENTKYARGTLVWDGATDRLSVQVVRKRSELIVSDSARYWAQGGISMSLGQDSEWEKQAELEHAPYPDDNRFRSAAVFDREGKLYLIVSSTKGSLESFREAILETVGKGKLEEGIFLDGDGSSQLKSKEKVLTGDRRPVVQMIRLIK